MAKNKNRKQGGPQNRAAQSEQAPQPSPRTATESRESMTHAQGDPADAARKQKKSFGHN
ncbi:hypothetical protein ACQEV4_36790 [Streptomyces shenzhenensis]|uniref:hypothetical protein n=1 Tax=Streptomyces shenzhenensis TaxID=943815 RepID=UPI00340F4DFA